MLHIPEIEISIRYKNGVTTKELTQIKNSEEVAAVCRELFNSDTILWTEEFIMLCLNRDNRVLGYYKVSQGGVAGTVADPKVVYTIALQATASAIIICHNHPSGNLKPSSADEMLTQKIKEAGNLLDIRLLDHLIISNDGYYSFADEGLL